MDLILEGKKTSTFRLFDDKDLSFGDDLILINKDTMEEFAKAKIIGVIVKKLGELTDEDYAGTEKFDNAEKKDKMYETFTKYYTQEVNVDTDVKIIKFELI